MKTIKLLLILLCMSGVFQAQSQFWRNSNQSYGDFLRSFYQDFRIDASTGILTQPLGITGIFSNTNFNYTLSLNYESNVISDDRFGLTAGYDYQLISASTPLQYYYGSTINNDGNNVPNRYEFGKLTIARYALKIGGEIWLSKGFTFTPNINIGYVDAYFPVTITDPSTVMAIEEISYNSYYDVGGGFDVRVALGLSVGLLLKYNYHYGLPYDFGVYEVDGGNDFAFYDIAIGLYFRLFKNDYEL